MTGSASTAGTQRDTQRGTQREAIEDSLSVMSTDRADSDIVFRVMNHSGLTDRELARECNLSPSTITRIRNGQWPVSVHVWRTLWRLTRDPLLLEYFGDDGTDIVAVAATAPPREAHARYIDLCQAQHELAMNAHDQLHQRVKPGSFHDRVMQSAERVIRAAHAIWRTARLERSAPQSPDAQCPVPDARTSTEVRA